MQYFPLFLDLKAKPVLVVGGGEVASRKVDTLIRAGADVTIVSPSIENYLQAKVDAQECRWVQSFYHPGLMSNEYVQVWATTDNNELNHQVHKDAKEKGLLVNVVDDLPYCDFITPSLVNRGRIQIAISSGGASPVLVRKVREKFESVLPFNLSLLADFCASKRNSIKEHFSSVDERRKFWEVFLNDTKVELAQSREELEALYQESIATRIDMQGSLTWLEFGADPELLTLKALKKMQQAELVLHPQDCPFEYIDLCRRDAEREAYADSAELSSMLANPELKPMRVVVFIPQGSAEFKLLTQHASIMTQGA